MTAAAPRLRVSPAQREVLERVARSATAAHREVARARVLLDAADGSGNKTIAARHGVTAVTVRAWRSAFEVDGLTTKTTPPGATHWSCRTMARRVGVSPATVQRIWSELGLQPHRVDSFKVSNDPQFTEKLIDGVGLCLDPPDKAIVLCMDETSQIQALDRTQATLPMTPGRAATMTHDYKRNGTTTLFAALDVLTGTSSASACHGTGTRSS